MHLLRKFMRLPNSEKKCFLKAVFMLFYYKLRLKTTSLQTIFTSVYTRSQKVQSKTIDHSIAPERIARLIVVAGRLVPSSTCLSKAFAGKILFAENGYNTELHLGVCKNAAVGLEAHAWLSLDGKIVLGYLPNLNRYKEFPLLTYQDFT